MYNKDIKHNGECPMEYLITEKDKPKLYNKKHKENVHLLITDRKYQKIIRPCICDFDNNILYYLSDKSSALNTETYMYSPEEEELLHIRELPTKKSDKKSKTFIPHHFQISIRGKQLGYVVVSMDYLDVNLEGYATDWRIAYSGKIDLGFDYKYSVFRQGSEIAHFRSFSIRHIPMYILDHAAGEDELLLIALFIIHSVYINKLMDKDLKKEDHLSRSKGFFKL